VEPRGLDPDQWRHIFGRYVAKMAQDCGEVRMIPTTTRLEYYFAMQHSIGRRTVISYFSQEVF
jgi:hypothetical protein